MPLLSILCQLHSLRCSLTVFLSQGTGHGSQELLHSHVDLGGELLGELHGKHHKDAVGEKLQGEEQILDPTVKKKKGKKKGL